VETIKPTRNLSFILGFLAKGEVDAMFKQNPFEIPSTADPISLWRQSEIAVRSLQPTPPATDIRILEDTEQPVIREIKARGTYKKYYEALADYVFALVPANSLLAPQSLADFDYIYELSSRLSANASLDDQLRFAMPDGIITEPVIAGNQVVFASHGRDLHAEQVPTVRQVGSGDFEIVVSATSRPNYIQAAQLGQRLVLTNGVHKVCAMVTRGYTHVPCLLRQIGRIEEAGLNIQSTLFRPQLFAGPRPAQVIDFLDERVAVPVHVRSMQQVLRIGIMTEILHVPTVPQPAYIPRPSRDVQTLNLAMPAREARSGNEQSEESPIQT
jgi:hypothetical protein